MYCEFCVPAGNSIPYKLLLASQHHSGASPQTLNKDLFREHPIILSLARQSRKVNSCITEVRKRWYQLLNVI